MEQARKRQSGGVFRTKHFGIALRQQNEGNTRQHKHYRAGGGGCYLLRRSSICFPPLLLGFRSIDF